LCPYSLKSIFIILSDKIKNLKHFIRISYRESREEEDKELEKKEE
jgi:hypothetical protein